MTRRRINYFRCAIFALVCVALLYGISQAIMYVFNVRSVSVMLQNGKDTNLGVSFVRQLVAKDNSTARTIMFASEAKKSYLIEYRKSGSRKLQSVKAVDASFKDGEDSYIQYVAKLEQLTPSTKYEYRIVQAKDDTNKENKPGSWHELETDNKGEFTAMIFADAQSSGTYKEWIAIADKAYSKNKKSKLYLNLGDQVDCGAHGYQWKRWFTGIEPFSADIPMATLVGNHEVYNMQWEEAFPKAYINLFHVPSALEQYKHQFYSFDYGNVHFVVLDTNHRDEMVKYQPYMANAQLSWLRQDLANSKAKWKVALMHRDILMYRFSEESGRACNWQTYVDYSGRDFMPIFEQYGVDAVLSGHLHTYRRRVPLKNFRPDNKGITYIMLGVSGNQSYGNLWADFEWDAKRSPDRKDTRNYMTMKASDKQLELRAFLEDGTQFDEVILKK